MAKIPARCNKRSCQARRNIDRKWLTAAPHQMPKCHKGGCDGRMYVDKTRLEGRDNHQPICTDPHCPLTAEFTLKNNGRVFPHKVSTRGCSGYEAYVMNSAIRDSKHKPFRDNQPEEEPF